jgi:hypothetical protein
MHTRLALNSVLKDFLKKSDSLKTATYWSWINRNKKATNYEKDGYFINAWLLLKFPPKVQLLRLV